MAVVTLSLSLLLFLLDTYPSHSDFINSFPVDTAFSDGSPVYDRVSFKVVPSCSIRHNNSAQIFSGIIAVFNFLDNAITGSTGPDLSLPCPRKSQSSYDRWRASQTTLVTTPASPRWSARWLHSLPQDPRFYG